MKAEANYQTEEVADAMASPVAVAGDDTTAQLTRIWQELLGVWMGAANRYLRSRTWRRSTSKKYRACGRMDRISSAAIAEVEPLPSRWRSGSRHRESKLPS